MSNGTDEEILNTPLRTLMRDAARTYLLRKSYEKDIARVTTEIQELEKQITNLKSLDTAVVQAMYEEWYQGHIQEVNDHNERVAPLYARLMGYLTTIKTIRAHPGTVRPPDGVLTSVENHIHALLLFRKPREPEKRITPEEYRQRLLRELLFHFKDRKSLLGYYMTDQERHRQSLEYIKQFEKFLNSLPPKLLD